MLKQATDFLRSFGESHNFVCDFERSEDTYIDSDDFFRICCLKEGELRFSITKAEMK